MTSPVTTERDGAVAVIRIDDGKANAFGHTAIDALDAALADTTDAGAVVILGRSGMFSAGFDLKVMQAGPSGVRGLVEAGAGFLMRLYEHPVPVVAGVTGHALAMGALVVLACDLRIATDTGAKIGLNEVAIGMTLPVFGVEVARDRLAPHAFTRAVVLAEIFDPSGALDAGFVDRLVAPSDVEGVAMEEAARLADSLHTGASGNTKQSARRATVEHVRATLDTDMDLIGPPPGSDAS